MYQVHIHVHTMHMYTCTCIHYAHVQCMYLLSRAVSKTEMPLTMTTSEGESEENMFAKSRFIVSSLQWSGTRVMKRYLYVYMYIQTDAHMHMQTNSQVHVHACVPTNIQTCTCTMLAVGSKQIYFGQTSSYESSDDERDCEVIQINSFMHLKLNNMCTHDKN